MKRLYFQRYGAVFAVSAYALLAGVVVGEYVHDTPAAVASPLPVFHPPRVTK